MIRAASTTDGKYTASLHKTEDKGSYAATAILAGFGTPPTPGVICDEPIKMVVSFVAEQIRKSLEHLLVHRCEDMEHAKKLLMSKLSRINDTLFTLQRSFGQGIYLTGVISYFVGEDFICLPFGGACAYLWENNTCTVLTNPSDPKISGMPYITDALGGPVTFTASFNDGKLKEGMHLVCVTQAAEQDMLLPIVYAIPKTDIKLATYGVHKHMDSSIMPTAVQIITQSGLPPIEAGGELL